ncbi:hypothetical protein CRG98_014076 [Punica granatum]|uniref:Uncharacterized protein n=1 Tax=Punica granatum TaxID=22663 RepID=A0A2I0KCT6_PUNGR|nr:hypothetical protein CRG98_014076 [Punica granatum]
MEALLARVDTCAILMGRPLESRQPHDHRVSRNSGSPSSQSFGKHAHIPGTGNQTTRRPTGHSRRGRPPTLSHPMGRLHIHGPRKIPADPRDSPSTGR